MASVWFTDVQARPTVFLEVTSLTLEEFQIWSRPSRTLSQITKNRKVKTRKSLIF